MSALDELRAATKSRCFCIKLKHLNNRPCGPCAMLVLAERAIAEAQQASYAQFRQDRIGDSAPCKKCDGVGSRAYATTATWHGGAGGMTVTVGVCDRCWGSGSTRPWPSHRAQHAPRGPWCIGEGCNKTAIWCEDHGEEKQAPQVTRDDKDNE